MKTVVLTVTIAMGVAGVGEAQIAEGERIVEIWTCTLNEGHTIGDIGRINERWVELVRSAGAAGVGSFVLSHLVGTIGGLEATSDVSTSFLTLDSFSDVASWVASRRAEETPEGQEIMSAFKQANTCTANTLYRGRQY